MVSLLSIFSPVEALFVVLSQLELDFLCKDCMTHLEITPSYFRLVRKLLKYCRRMVIKTFDAFYDERENK